MDKLYYLRVRYGALLELLQVLYKNADKLFKEYINAKIEKPNEIAKKYCYYCDFIQDVREQAHILEKEIIEEESKRSY